MRKKVWLIISAAVLDIVLLLAGVVVRRISPWDTGVYIAADAPFIVFDNGSGEPVIMLPPEGKGDMFARLQTGDRILVFHSNAMMLSYPAQMNVFFCIRLKKGDVSDVPEAVMDSLKELGWLQGGTFGQNE